MDIRQYEYVIAIAETASISKAAEKIHVSQPTLSQFLTRLEKEIGVPLFIRSHNGFFPTAEGQVYLEGARTIIRASSEIHDKIEQMIGRRGRRLVIGLTHGRSARLFSSFLPNFLRKTPEIEIQMVEAPPTNIDELIRNGYLDFALAIDVRDDPSLVFEPFVSEEIVFVLGPGHPLSGAIAGELESGRGLMDLDRFKADPFILFKKGYRLRTLVDRYLARIGFEPRIYLETTENDLACNMASNDLGVSFVPRGFASKYPDLLPARLDPPLCWEFGALYRKGITVTPIMRSFIDSIADYAGDELNWIPTLDP